MQTRQSPSVSNLHRLAQRAGLENYENLSKNDLFQRLRDTYNIERLRRRELRDEKNSKSLETTLVVASSSSSSSSTAIKPTKKRKNDENISNIKSKKLKESINTVDPIMLAPIKKLSSWTYCRCNGSEVAFNLDTLIDYMLSTGDFSDPQTRTPFTDKELEDIDAAARKARIQRASVLEAKSNNTTVYADNKFRRDALLGLERLTADVVTAILTVIETEDPDDAHVCLLVQHFPLFADYFRQLVDADKSYAKACMSHFKQYLIGPPNRRNADNYGLIDFVINFFSFCERRFYEGEGAAIDAPDIFNMIGMGLM